MQILQLSLLADLSFLDHVGVLDALDDLFELVAVVLVEARDEEVQPADLILVVLDLSLDGLDFLDGEGEDFVV